MNQEDLEVTGAPTEMPLVFCSVGVDYENRKAYLIFTSLGCTSFCKLALNLKARAPASQKWPLSLDSHARSQAMKLNLAESRLDRCLRLLSTPRLRDSPKHNRFKIFFKIIFKTFYHKKIVQCKKTTSSPFWIAQLESRNSCHVLPVLSLLPLLLPRNNYFEQFDLNSS